MQGARLLHVSDLLLLNALSYKLVGPPPPTHTQGAKLLHVSDLLLLGRATIEESLLLLHWLRQSGHDRLGEWGRPVPPTAPAAAHRVRLAVTAAAARPAGRSWLWLRSFM